VPSLEQAQQLETLAQAFQDASCSKATSIHQLV